MRQPALCGAPAAPLGAQAPGPAVGHAPRQRAGALQNNRAVSPGIRIRGKKLPGDGGDVQHVALGSPC